MNEKNNLKPSVVYSDDFFLVLDKPPGWTVVDLEKYLANPSLPRCGIVHRLDKETSGAILVAKRRDVFDSLQQKFLERKVQKTYLALVHGRVKERKGSINADVGRLKENRKKFGVVANGRHALTDYEVLDYYTLGNDFFTYLKISPKTGRTHQIRIHLKYLGHSIVADPLYAGGKTLRRDHEIFSRMFLHASSINFNHPVTGKPVNVSVSLPADLYSALRKLQKVD